jgi:tRNA U55 pseudouridine synthase TruB
MLQGQHVGSCATVHKLRRENIGDFSVKDAWCLDDLVDRAWDAGLPRHPHRTRTQRYARNPMSRTAGVVNGES